MPEEIEHSIASLLREVDQIAGKGHNAADLFSRPQLSNRGVVGLLSGLEEIEHGLARDVDHIGLASFDCRVLQDRDGIKTCCKQ